MVEYADLAHALTEVARLLPAPAVTVLHHPVDQPSRLDDELVGAGQLTHLLPARAKGGWFAAML